MPTTIAWSSWLQTLIDVVAPSICPCCLVAEGPDLCADCQYQLPELDSPCPWCGSPGMKDDGDCRSCAGHGLTHIDRVVVRFPYQGLIKQLVGDAKAAGKPSAVRVLTGLIPDLALDLPTSAWVVPVPPAHGRRPGPHLATALARAVAKHHHLHFHRGLRLTRLAAEQHGLNLAQRRTNVEGLFAAHGDMPDCVVLVDDLLTSGATASAAASALRDQGARRVILVCIARAVRPNS